MNFKNIDAETLKALLSKKQDDKTKQLAKQIIDTLETTTNDTTKEEK
ncbi:hypothetical protein [Salinivibrio costicola]|nr:hypothetical protein [Salinivibrio costicola]